MTLKLVQSLMSESIRLPVLADGADCVKRECPSQSVLADGPVRALATGKFDCSAKNMTQDRMGQGGCQGPWYGFCIKEAPGGILCVGGALLMRVGKTICKELSKRDTIFENSFTFLLH